MSEVSTAVRKLRDKLGANQRQFAKLLGVSHGAVGGWESGRITPSPMALMSIGKISGEEREWWFAQAGDDYLVVDQTITGYNARYRVDEDQNKTLLVYRSAGPGPNRFTDDEAEDKLSLPRAWLPDPPSVKCLWVMDDLMAPMIRSGFLVLVDYRPVENLATLVGAIVAVRQERGVLIRWLRAIGDGHYLMPEVQGTAEAAVKVKKGDYQIVGRVVRWIGHLGPQNKGSEKT